LISCKTIEYVYIPSDCLVIPAIQVTEKDKESLKKYQDDFSYEFLKSLADQKDIREDKCVKN